MAGLELFLQQFLEQRRPEFGSPVDEIQSIELPDPLRRFYCFAGRWPGHNSATPFANRFCMQDTLCAIRENGYAPTLQLMDGRLVFVWENQGVWVAATERTGTDPPVWLSENCSHREILKVWRRLDNPLSHFLVSFVLQELLFGSRILGVSTNTRALFNDAGVKTEPVWLKGEYAWNLHRPSYFLAAGCIIVRNAPNEADGDDWYGCNSTEGERILISLRLPTSI
ncbi:MAG: hypothetical protein SFX18_20020 [Pirellulales bacterium]|nr:hypothetical protein [Pirellulales bacterium]